MMRWFWGGLSLVAFVVAMGGVFVISNGGESNALFGGVVAFIGLLTAYFANRIGRRLRYSDEKSERKRH